MDEGAAATASDSIAAPKRAIDGSAATCTASVDRFAAVLDRPALDAGFAAGEFAGKPGDGCAGGNAPSVTRAGSRWVAGNAGSAAGSTDSATAEGVVDRTDVPEALTTLCNPPALGS
jgi:hypothetical protein